MSRCVGCGKYRFISRAAAKKARRRLDGRAVQGREWYAPGAEVLAVVNEMRDTIGMPMLEDLT